MSYNGYSNYQTCNVCLWISNDEELYEFAKDCKNYADFKARLRELDPDSAIAYETPDGIAWSDSGIDLAEMQEFWTEIFGQVEA